MTGARVTGGDSPGKWVPWRAPGPPAALGDTGRYKQPDMGVRMNEGFPRGWRESYLGDMGTRDAAGKSVLKK